MKSAPHFMKKINALSRRSFLQHTLSASAVLALAPTARILGANDDIRVAVVGFRSKGSDHIQALRQLAGVRIVALCDADEDVLNKGVDNLKKLNLNVTGYLDIRRLLEQKDVDAIITATPNHWHALATVWACQAGKDVYVEKPVSHEIWEGRKAVEAARKYNRVVQAGTQSRSDPALKEAFTYMQQGNLGKIVCARGFCYKRRQSIGKVTGPQDPPKTVNMDLWTGPAQLLPLMRKNLHYDWHWVWNTGNGDIGNQGIHEMDMCRWALGQKGLAPRVMSLGGRFGYVDDGETPNTQIAVFDYQPAPLIFEVRGLPRNPDEEGEAMDNYLGARVGIVIHCENGYFVGGAGGGWICNNEGKKLKQYKGTGGADHQANFFTAMRSRKATDLNADIEQGHLSSALCHMGNISYRLGQLHTRDEMWERIKGNKEIASTFERCESHLAANKVDIKGKATTLGPWLTMDPAKEHFVGDFAAPANALVKREYRKPFVIPDQV
jgi:predicted dehydrogenase